MLYAQTSAAGHCNPQPLQLFGSMVGSTQLVPQIRSPGGHGPPVVPLVLPPEVVLPVPVVCEEDPTDAPPVVLEVDEVEVDEVEVEVDEVEVDEVEVPTAAVPPHWLFVQLVLGQEGSWQSAFVVQPPWPSPPQAPSSQVPNSQVGPKPLLLLQPEQSLLWLQSPRPS